ncbi:ATP-binding cassette domain-containing protein [Pseudorhodoferax sp.]|uniref:ATP-binding cassette domain-containing protein n=1 Tax=Pseudorhodoferax sp. TaxID=1993553 RepID=UPI002DD62CF5|nr:ATP-binding cassette domain-containing protein [Pseudorhodoferax sp.]
MNGTVVDFRFDDITCGYGDTVVVRSLEGRVAAGQVLGVLGRNGVGKSTLVKALAGVLPLTQGRVQWRGRDLTGQPLHGRLAAGVAYAPQENVVFGDLSVHDNLWLHHRGRHDGRYDTLFTHFPRLQQRLGQRAGSLSGGERKLLSFARTLALAAPLTLMDEPTEGVQPENIDRMAALVKAACAQGRCFVIVEQNLAFLESLADTVLVIDHGEAVLAGAMPRFTRAQLERHLVV